MNHETQNIDNLRAEMALLAFADPSNLAPPVCTSETNLSYQAKPGLPTVDLKNPGLTRAQLENQRWKVSASVAEDTFMRLGLPLEGRAARKIYAWPLILKLEGVPEKLARRASPDTHLYLFEALIDAKNASLLLGISQQHLRKQADAGQLFGCDVIRFGARGMYRFRAAQIAAEGLRRIKERLVGGTSKCAQ